MILSKLKKINAHNLALYPIVAPLDNLIGIKTRVFLQLAAPLEPPHGTPVGNP